MNDDKDTVNYMDSINKASRKRRRKPSFWEQYGILVIGAVVLAVIVVAVVFGGKAVNAVKGKMAAAQAASESASESESAEEASLQAEEESRAEIESESAETDAKIKEVIDSYSNLGIAKVTGYLNIRKDPNEAANVIGTLSDGSACEILETLEGWYKISSGGITGYVKSEYILTGDAAKEAAMSHAELMAIVHADRLNARTEPSTDAKIWTQISENERYHVAEQLDGWVKIEFDEGGEGDGNDEISSAYVSSEFVEVRYALSEAIKFSPTEESASLRSRIVNYAMKFLGNPYVWGGTSLTKGADCSGFTMSVMKNFGISLPHYSGSQANSGKRIKSSQMKPGDLIFYGSSRGRINHVAMYIGNGQIIHAASRRSGIKISTWNYRTPVCIVDVIGNRS